MPDTTQAAEQGYKVPPVQRAIALLHHIAAGGRCRNLSRSANELGINRTTLIRLIHTLAAEGMIEEIDEGAGWRLGPGLIALAGEAMNARGVAEVTRPILQRLVRSLSLSAHLGIRHGRDIVYLARETPNAHLVSNVREGTRLPAHATTIGRILLAHLPPEEVAALYADAPLEAYTESTCTTLKALQAQLAEDRALGIARSVGNFEPGIGSCAVAVFDHRGRAVGAINVTGNAADFVLPGAFAERIERETKQAAMDASIAMGYRPRADQPCA